VVKIEMMTWFVTQCIVVDGQRFRSSCLLNVYIYREVGSRNSRRN